MHPFEACMHGFQYFIFVDANEWVYILKYTTFGSHGQLKGWFVKTSGVLGRFFKDFATILNVNFVGPKSDSKLFWGFFGSKSDAK